MDSQVLRMCSPRVGLGLAGVNSRFLPMVTSGKYPEPRLGRDLRVTVSFSAFTEKAQGSMMTTVLPRGQLTQAPPGSEVEGSRSHKARAQFEISVPILRHWLSTHLHTHQAKPSTSLCGGSEGTSQSDCMSVGRSLCLSEPHL